MKVNKYNKLDKFKTEINQSLKSQSLNKLNPIFNHVLIDATPTGSMVFFICPHPINEIPTHIFHENLISMSAQTQGPSWIVIENIALKLLILEAREEPKLSVEIFRLRDIPSYLQCLVNPARRIFKGKIINVNDNLPVSIFMQVIIQIKDTRNEILSLIARLLGVQEHKEIQTIFEDKNIPLRESLDRIFRFVQAKFTTEYSYCLTCGKEIAKGRMFCDPNKSDSTKKHLNSFNYWLKQRARIKTVADRKQKRETLHKELEQLATKYLDPWRVFKDKHPEIFTNRYAEGWRKRKKHRAKI